MTTVTTQDDGPGVLKRGQWIGDFDDQLGRKEPGDHPGDHLGMIKIRILRIYHLFQWLRTRDGYIIWSFHVISRCWTMWSFRKPSTSTASAVESILPMFPGGETSEPKEFHGFATWVTVEIPSGFPATCNCGLKAKTWDDWRTAGTRQLSWLYPVSDSWW